MNKPRILVPKTVVPPFDRFTMRAEGYWGVQSLLYVVGYWGCEVCTRKMVIGSAEFPELNWLLGGDEFDMREDWLLGGDEFIWNSSRDRKHGHMIQGFMACDAAAMHDGFDMREDWLLGGAKFAQGR